MRDYDEILGKIEELCKHHEEIEQLLSSYDGVEIVDVDDEVYIQGSLTEIRVLNAMIIVLRDVLTSVSPEVALDEFLERVRIHVANLEDSIKRIEDTTDEDMLVELDWRIEDVYVKGSVYRILRWAKGLD